MSGRPRSTKADVALRDAVVASLVARGYAATTVDAVARAAGVPKSTLYRRWSSKAEMVFETVIHERTLDPPPATGSLAGDLLAISRTILGALSGPAVRRAIPGVLDEAFGEGGSALRSRVVGSERTFVRTALERARRAGELGEGTDLDALATTLHAQLLGTTLAWTTVFDDPLPADVADRLARAALATVAAEEALP